MQVREAVQFISLDFKNRKGVELPKGALAVLEEFVATGRAVALESATEEVFDAAVLELSNKLVLAVELQRQRRIGGEDSFVVTTAGLRDTLRKLCPMFPFC